VLNVVCRHILWLGNSRHYPVYSHAFCSRQVVTLLDSDAFLECAKERSEMGLNITGLHDKWRKDLEITAEVFVSTGFVECILVIQLGLLIRPV
jgi:hypothetical protein